MSLLCRGVFELVSFSKMYKLLGEPWIYMNKSCKRLKKKKKTKLAELGTFVGFGSRSCCRQSRLVCSGRARGQRPRPRTWCLGLAQLPGLSGDRAFSPFPASESFVLVLNSLSRKSTLLTISQRLLLSARGQVSPIPACTDLGTFEILESSGSESCEEEERGQPGCGFHCSWPAPLFAPSLSQYPSHTRRVRTVSRVTAPVPGSPPFPRKCSFSDVPALGREGAD